MFREFPVTKIVSELASDSLLPAILFRTSRKQCDEDVERLSGARVGRVPGEDQNELVQLVRKVIDKYQMEESVIFGHPHYAALIETATGAHHAGQLLQWRLLLEEIMSFGKLRLMIATGTVAAGVDFPARSVVITAHSKRGADGFKTLTSSEFQQMSGRAGRRGKDTIGTCIVAPGQFSDARVFLEVAQKPPEPLRSAYFAAPSTVLNLLKFRSVDDLRFTVSKSLASFVDRKSAEGLRAEAERYEREAKENEKLSAEQQKKLLKKTRRKVREADALEVRQNTQLDLSLTGLRSLEYLDEIGLTEKGVWAAELCTSLVLHLAEATQDGLFYELTPIELAGLVGSIAGDSYRVYFSLAENIIPVELFDKLRQVVARIQEKYSGPSTTAETQVVPHAALTVTTWMCADDWANFSALLRLAGVAEGDAARLITQTADHLHQLSRLHETHPDLAKTALDARDVLLRPPLSDSLVTVGST